MTYWLEQLKSDPRLKTPLIPVSVRRKVLKKSILWNISMRQNDCWGALLLLVSILCQHFVTHNDKKFTFFGANYKN